VAQPGAPVRSAIVGTGNIARSHAKAIAASQGAATLVAAMDVDQGQLGSFCAEFQIPAAYSDLNRLLSHARPDLVHICTPPSTHRPIARTCLDNGTSVLVEKPPTISLREFDELVAAQGGAAHDDAADAGGPPWFATVFQHRFGARQRHLAALAASGALGRPLLAICDTTWFRDQAYFDVPWRGRWDTEGGGPTMGHGIHQMDMLLDVLGDWTEVSAITRTQARTVATEDLSLAHVTFANGAVASVVNSVLSPREESYLRFDFACATVELTHLYGYSDDDWRITPAPGREEEIAAAWKHPGDAGTVASTGEGAAERTGHAAQFAHVFAALREGRRPPVTPAEARRTMALIAGIYASAFTRRPVTPADLGPGDAFYAEMNGGHQAW
jgi:predicted dehydrogenase